MASSVIGALRVNLGIDTAAFSKGLKASQTNLQKFAAVAKVGLAAAAGAAVGLGMAFKKTVDAADEIGIASQKFGVGVEEMSRLKHAAEMVGSSMDTVGRAMVFLEKNHPGMTLDQVADRLAAMPEGAARSAEAMRLLGKSGVELIPMLNQGAAGLAKMKAEADALGIVFTPEMVAASDQFNDNMDRLWKVLGGLGNQIAAALVPHLATLTDWLVANAPRIVEAVLAFGRFAVEVGKAGIAIGSFVVGVVDAFDRFDAAILAMRERVISNFIAMKDGAIAAVSGMVTGIGEWVTGRLNAIWDGVIGKVQAVGDKIKWLYDSAVGNSWIPDLVTESEGWFDRLGSSFGSTIAGLVKGTTTWREALAGLLETIAGTFSGNNFGAGSGFFGNLIGGLGGGLTGGAMGMAPAMAGAAGGGGGMGGLNVNVQPSPLFAVVVDKQVSSGLSRAPAVMADRQARGLR